MGDPTFGETELSNFHKFYAYGNERIKRNLAMIRENLSGVLRNMCETEKPNGLDKGPHSHRWKKAGFGDWIAFILAVNVVS